MDFLKLNPYIRSVSLYEKPPIAGECIAYDERLIYIISGDLQLTVGGEKLGHISVGNTVFIPRGTPYKMKSKYVRMVVVTFDLTSDSITDAELIHPVSQRSLTRKNSALCPRAHLIG